MHVQANEDATTDSQSRHDEIIEVYVAKGAVEIIAAFLKVVEEESRETEDYNADDGMEYPVEGSISETFRAGCAIHSCAWVAGGGRRWKRRVKIRLHLGPGFYIRFPLEQPASVFLRRYTMTAVE